MAYEEARSRGHGQSMVRAREHGHGQSMGKHGQNMLKARPGHTQSMLRARSGHAQSLRGQRGEGGKRQRARGEPTCFVYAAAEEASSTLKAAHVTSDWHSLS